MDRPVTPYALAGFFALSTLLILAAGTSLLTPGGALDWIWTIKPAEHARLLAMGPVVGAGFLVLSLAMAAAAYGTFSRRRWGYRLAVAIFLVNGLGDAARGLSGGPAEGVIGVMVTAIILWWLSRSKVRRLFA
jgi:hypothetical protein